MQIAVTRDTAKNVVATLELSKDGDTGAEIVSKLEVVEVGTDEDGEAMTSCVIAAVDGPAEPSAKKAARAASEQEPVRRALVDAYDRLADGVPLTTGLDGKSSGRKVKVDTLRDEVKSRGFLLTDDDGRVTVGARKLFQRAKDILIDGKTHIEDKGYLWKLT